MKTTKTTKASKSAVVKVNVAFVQEIMKVKAWQFSTLSQLKEDMKKSRVKAELIIRPDWLDNDAQTESIILMNALTLNKTDWLVYHSADYYTVVSSKFFKKNFSEFEVVAIPEVTELVVDELALVQASIAEWNPPSEPESNNPEEVDAMAKDTSETPVYVDERSEAEILSLTSEQEDDINEVKIFVTIDQIMSITDNGKGEMEMDDLDKILSEFSEDDQMKILEGVDKAIAALDVKPVEKAPKKRAAPVIRLSAKILPSVVVNRRSDYPRK